MADWITRTIESLGYIGIGLLMFLENLFPPLPSELIMPLAGFTASQGEMALVPAIAAGVIGTMLGALPWYYLGKFLGEARIKRWIEKHGRWLGFSTEDVDKSKQWFYRRGRTAVFLCRMVPGVRTLISLPAGFSDMPMPQFLIYSTLGTLGWVILLTLAGYILGENYELVEQYLGPVAKIVLITLAIAFIVWIVRRVRNQRKLK
ncbi:MAG: DedA family protein [Elainellaceae cyanobacterium]